MDLEWMRTAMKPFADDYVVTFKVNTSLFQEALERYAQELESLNAVLKTLFVFSEIAAPEVLISSVIKRPHFDEDALYERRTWQTTNLIKPRALNYPLDYLLSTTANASP